MVTIIKFINIAKLVFLFFKTIKSKIVAIIKQMRRCGIVLLFLKEFLNKYQDKMDNLSIKEASKYI